MRSTLAPVIALLVSVAMLLMGNGLQGTLLPVRAQFEEFSSLSIGVLGSSYFIGFALGCLLGPRAVRRVGHIRAFTAMVSIASTVSIAHAMVLTPWSWWILRAITGFCFAALYMVIESWLNEKSTNETRGFVFSVYTIINLTVITIGQMMLTVGSPTTFTLFALASILVSLAAVPVALTTAAAPQPLESVQIRPRYLFSISPVAFLGCLGVGLANGSFWSLGPVFAQRESGDVTAVALFMSVTVIAGAIGQYPLGRLSDRMDRRRVIIIACLGSAAAGIGLVVSNHIWPAGVLLMAAGFGVFAFPIYSICVAHMNDFVETGGFVEAASGLLLVFAAGAAIGPIVASTVMRFYGTDALFGFTASVHLATAVLTVYRMRKRAGPAHHANFDECILVASTVATLHPSDPSLAPGDTDAAEQPGGAPAQTRDEAKSD